MYLLNRNLELLSDSIVEEKLSLVDENHLVFYLFNGLLDQSIKEVDEQNVYCYFTGILYYNCICKNHIIVIIVSYF